MRQELYLLRALPDEFDCLRLPRRQDRDWLDRFNGRKPVNISRSLIANRYPVGRRGDFPYLVPHVPVCSQSAWRVLQPLIHQDVQAVPIRCENEIFYALNVVSVLDCLDKERSSIERFESGHILDVMSYVLMEECWHGQIIFKIKGTELQDILVSEAFKHAVETHRLQGARFLTLDRNRAG